MSQKKNNDKYDPPVAELLGGYFDEMLVIAKECNKHARKRNRLAKRQHEQSILSYEQAERQYLMDKSKMQPTFRLSATEFLMCEPDFMNDPEQASEAKYLAGFGLSVDERVLRIKIHVKGNADIMRPRFVVNKSQKESDNETAYAMTQFIHFVPVASIEMLPDNSSSMIYLVYRDQTTLPVVHKYRLSQQQDSALRRWEAVHLDTVYVTSHKNLSTFNRSRGCAALFVGRDEL